VVVRAAALEEVGDVLDDRLPPTVRHVRKHLGEPVLSLRARDCAERQVPAPPVRREAQPTVDAPPVPRCSVMVPVGRLLIRHSSPPIAKMEGLTTAPRLRDETARPDGLTR
jgi:hypothetical protein